MRTIVILALLLISSSMTFAAEDEFVAIKGGKFLMGSPETENWRSDDEEQHEEDEPGGETEPSFYLLLRTGFLFLDQFHCSILSLVCSFVSFTKSQNMQMPRASAVVLSTDSRMSPFSKARLSPPA